uniref:hypothetical protein n=1 Tax=Prevotella sp. TaxID=59823 RepID=UPI004026EC14
MTAPQRGVILGFLLVERAVADGCFPVMMSDGMLLVLVSVVVKVGCISIEKTNKILLFISRFSLPLLLRREGRLRLGNKNK